MNPHFAAARSRCGLAWYKRACIGHVVAICLLVLISGCSKEPGTPYLPAAKVAMARPVDFIPPPGKASIYVIRPEMVLGGGVPWPVLLDAELFGMVRITQYIQADVPPGEHTLVVSGGSNFTFQTQAGQNYFYLVRVSPSTGNVRQISEDQGRAYVMEYAR
jgi:hypothetical protein